jgi:signal transduction histidine kinase
VTPLSAPTWRTRVEPFAGDIVLAVVVAVAAASAAAGATSDEPKRAFLVVLAGAAACSLAARRRYPVTVLAVTALTTGFFALVYDGYWPFAALLAFYSVAAHSVRKTAIVSGAVALAVLAGPIAHTLDWQPLTWSKLARFAGQLAPLVAAWVLGDNMRTRRAYLRAVEDRAAQLEREQEANASRAAAEEQARIAREVHDVVAHNLSVIIVQATAAERVFASDPPDAERAVRAIGSTARQALDELRRVLAVVRSDEPGPAAFSPQPGLERLDGLLDQVRTAGLEVELEIAGEPRALPSALELSAYRIVQEALTNTLRHAGAQHATVSLRFDDDALKVEIVDDGTSPAGGNGADGRGLIGMRERVATFGGQVETGPGIDGGFRVVARLPLAASEQ